MVGKTLLLLLQTRPCEHCPGLDSSALSAIARLSQLSKLELTCRSLDLHTEVHDNSTISPDTVDFFAKLCSLSGRIGKPRLKRPETCLQDCCYSPSMIGSVHSSQSNGSSALCLTGLQR